MKTFNSVSALKNHKIRLDHNVFVNGYFQAGDGGGGHYHWDKNCVLPANNGTVIPSDHSDTGRWLLIHQGVGDFRTFGILNADQPADDALDALVNDPAISQIFAF